MDCVAFEDAAIDAYPTRAAWDASAAEITRTALDRWHLSPGEAYVGGEAASVIAVTTRDGDAAVLKVGYPHVEAVGEALALEAWGPGLSPRVLRQDPWTWTMLLERIEPGEPLSHAGLPADEAIDIAMDLFGRFTVVPVPEGVPALSTIIDGYLTSAHARLGEQRDDLVRLDALELVTHGLAEAAALAAADGGEHFLHGDFNPGNIIRDAREPQGWVVIDPKPMRGDREFDVWPLVEQLGSPWTRVDPVAALAGQLRRAVDAVGADYALAARWAFVRAALNVSWYLEDGNRAAASGAAAELRVCAGVVASRVQ